MKICKHLKNLRRYLSIGNGVVKVVEIVVFLASVMIVVVAAAATSAAAVVVVVMAGQ